MRATGGDPSQGQGAGRCLLPDRPEGLTTTVSHASRRLPPLVVIGGATATGKTALSLAVAGAVQGAEIVCADSRQVYRGMDIGTAKPTADERAFVPHHGLDLVDPDETFTVAHFRRAALASLESIAGRAGIAVLVGGTGLYLRVIGHGVPVDDAGAEPAIRADLERRLADDGLAALVRQLQGRDPAAAAAIDLANPRRVVRALERSVVTGSAQAPPPRGYPAPVLWLGLHREAALRAPVIEARARHQFESGLLDEADALRARFGEDQAAFSAIGYREAFAVLAGLTDIPSAIASTTARTRAYAKRQRTWFRAQPDFIWLDADAGPAVEAAAHVDAFLGRERERHYAWAG